MYHEFLMPYVKLMSIVNEHLHGKGYVYVGATMSDKSGDKSELPWFSNSNSLLSPLLSLIAAPT
jgi:hypothetical protein